MTTKHVLGLVLFLGASQVRSGGASDLALSSLSRTCGLTTRLVPNRTWSALWMACGGEATIVAHPLNLSGHVQVRTREQALEFVRLFAGPDTYLLFPLVGEVEVGRGKETRAFTLAEDLFDSLCPIANASINAGSGEQATFSVRRCVVRLEDRALYEVLDVIDQAGNLQRPEKRLLKERVDRIGLIPVGPM